MKATLVLLAPGLALLTACILSLLSGKTFGLYGVTETRSSVFYWLIVVTYGGLALLCFVFALRALWR
jgi:hypothetical protein